MLLSDIRYCQARKCKRKITFREVKIIYNGTLVQILQALR